MEFQKPSSFLEKNSVFLATMMNLIAAIRVEGREPFIIGQKDKNKIVPNVQVGDT